MRAFFQLFKKDLGEKIERDFGEKMDKKVDYKMKKKRGVVVLDNIIWAILALLIILLILYFLLGSSIVEWFKNLPGYKYNEIDKVVEKLPEDYEIQTKYFKVAVIRDGSSIKFCTNGDCNKLRSSKLLISGSETEGWIEVDQTFNKNIGWVINGHIALDAGVSYGYGNLYFKVKDDLPSFQDLLNLDNSVFISGVIYKKSGVEIEKSDSYINKGVSKDEKIDKSPEDISNYFSGTLEELEWTVWFDLEEKISNSHGETGWKTGSWNSDNLASVQYAKSDGYIWVRFRDSYWAHKDITPWIRMDYWNKYRSYARVPEEYVAVIYNKGDIEYK